MTKNLFKTGFAPMHKVVRLEMILLEYSNVNFTQVMRQRSAPASFDAEDNEDYESDDDNIPLPPQPYHQYNEISLALSAS